MATLGKYATLTGEAYWEAGFLWSAAKIRGGFSALDSRLSRVPNEYAYDASKGKCSDWRTEDESPNEQDRRQNQIAPGFLILSQRRQVHGEENDRGTHDAPQGTNTLQERTYDAPDYEGDTNACENLPLQHGLACID